MGVFDQKSKFKAAPKIRKVIVPVEAPPPAPKPSLSNRPRLSSATPGASSSSSSRPRKSTAPGSARSSRHPSATPSISPPRLGSPAYSDVRTARKPKHSSAATSLSSHTGDRKNKRKITKHRPSPASDRVDFNSDSDTAEDDWETAISLARHKRPRPSYGEEHEDVDRKLAHPELLKTLGKDEGNGGDSKDEKSEEGTPFSFIHAVEVASRKLKCVPVFGAKDEEVEVELQYPGSRQRERFELVNGKDKIDAVKDIRTTIEHIAETYLTEEQAEPILNPTSGVVRQMQRASSDTVKDAHLFRTALDTYNELMRKLHDDGTVARNLLRQHSLRRDLVAFMLDQVYDRTVAPKVELLRKYENGTDNVYGELLHRFITEILVDRLAMRSDQVFVDLGSGVGNVVLQAALEIGCESWGCEMMENACNLAEAQQREFAARCRLWGIRAGDVHLERGDFRGNERIQEVLKRADVVLVNNQAFTSQLNDDLVRMFLDFKPGCKIVSLKSFVHDHKSASYNINDVGSTILDVEQLTYPEEYVSWTSAAGTFCISTRK